MQLDYPALQTWTPRARAVLRLVTAYLFIQHGTSKFFGAPQPMPGSLDVFSIVGLAGALELVGSVLLALGLFTRPTAFVLCGFMAVAYFMGHAGQGHMLTPMLNGGELAVLYCFVFLYFIFSGPGAWSVDGARRRSI
jgi:putative oxidoreductase